MRFSLLHASARPDQWRTVYDAWITSAEHPEDVEYILVCDERWGFHPENPPQLRPQDKVLFNFGRKCYVEGVNLAAAASTGDILIVIADDQFPCDYDRAYGPEYWKQHGMERPKLQWDRFLSSNVTVRSLHTSEFVLFVNTGTPSEVERGIIVMPIVSRARYEKLGYLFYPRYESMYADNDLHDHARKDGIVYMLPRTVIFEHRHPLFTGAPMDDAYRAQNRPEAYQLGLAIWNARKNNGFTDIGPVKVESIARKTKPSLCVLAPGETFNYTWVNCWTALLPMLNNNFDLDVRRGGGVAFGYSSNVYATRQVMLRTAVLNCEVKPEFVLWIDDDNLVGWKDVQTLYQDLLDHPEVDAACGWCWLIREGKWYLSCGHVLATGMSALMSYEDVMKNPGPDGDLHQVDWTGFPLVLMRYSAIEKAGKNPFAPRLVAAADDGFCGEDVAFGWNARERGNALFVVDRRVKVPHLKLGPQEPPIGTFDAPRKERPAEVSRDIVAV